MGQFKTYADVLQNSFKLYKDSLALRWRNNEGHFEEMTYAGLEETTKAIGCALIARGFEQREHVGLIADVSQYWNLTDTSLMQIGCVEVPRGTDSTGSEIGYILNHSGSKKVFVHNGAQVAKIEKGLEEFGHKIELYIVLDDSVPSGAGENIISFTSLIKEGEELVKNGDPVVQKFDERRSSIKPEDLGTIVYTSGTTGEPKGVMLSHKNFAAQLNLLPGLADVGSSDSGLTLLPPWHIFGRITEYIFLAVGGSITYTDIKNIGQDMRDIKPTYVPAVPRIWEGVYGKIIGNVKKQGKEPIFNFFKDKSLKYIKYKNILLGKERVFVAYNPLVNLFRKLFALVMMVLYKPLQALGSVLVFKKVLMATGGRLKASISGGGALPGHVDDFFAAIGVNIMEGYGLTETCPVLSVRLPSRIIPGTVGPLIEGTEGKLLDSEGKDVTNIPDAKGTLHVRGPQVMSGYYKNPEKTKAVLDDDGWFNTGDLIKFNVTGELSIVGRSKDTIVLVGGENVEPTPIEEKLKESELVDHCMAVGQDKKTIGMLIVPNEEAVMSIAEELGVNKDMESIIASKEINDKFKKEIARLVSADTGFKTFEKVSVFRLLSKAFEQGDELNNTLKVKRHVVTDKYEGLIEEMYN